MARNDRMRSDLTDDVRERVKKLEPIAKALGITRAQLALAWILRQRGVSSAITGASKVSQVESNVEASGVTLDPDVLLQIDALFPLQ